MTFRSAGFISLSHKCILCGSEITSGTDASLCELCHDAASEVSLPEIPRESIMAFSQVKGKTIKFRG